MDHERLEALRAKYKGAGATAIADPVFAEAAGSAFDSEGRRRMPFGGLPTLLDFPAVNDLSELDIALVGIPMDLGVTNRTGARFGPRALRTIERIGPFNHGLRVTPGTHERIGDVGDVPLQSRYSLSQSMADIETEFARLHQAGLRTLAVGGDHSVTYPILKALGADAPLGMVHIDAHCDTAGPFEGEKFHHGGPFRLAVLDGVLDPARSIQIGIRGASEYLWEFSTDAGMTVVHAEAVDEMGIEALIAQVLDVIGTGPTYVTIDVDGIDPAYTPGTGTPEVGGLTPREVQRLLRGLAAANIVGGDVVEVAPQYDPSSNTAQVGAQMLFEILSLMALTHRRDSHGSK
ncbi:MAG: agmatinase [Pseudomonadota bacterium]